MTNARNFFKIEMSVMKVSVFTIFVDLTLSLVKLIVGIAASSGAMISDAIHSAADVFSALIVMIGTKMANKTSDAQHPYGHERLECVAATMLAIVLGATGCGIGFQGIQKICNTGSDQMITPKMAALVVAVIAIFVKEMMFLFTRKIARQIDSGVLLAEAWHHRSDALASIGGFIGILGARLGIPVMDPAASVVISLFIIKAAWEIFADAVRKMIDVSCDDATIGLIRRIAEEQTGVICVTEVKTRLFGNKKYVDITICADGTKTLEETHGIAEEIHKDVEKTISGVKHCMVCVNPYRERG